MSPKTQYVVTRKRENTFSRLAKSAVTVFLLTRLNVCRTRLSPTASWSVPFATSQCPENRLYRFSFCHWIGSQVGRKVSGERRIMIRTERKGPAFLVSRESSLGAWSILFRAFSSLCLSVTSPLWSFSFLFFWEGEPCSFLLSPPFFWLPLRPMESLSSSAPALLPRSLGSVLLRDQHARRQRCIRMPS